MITKTLENLVKHAEAWPREDQEELADYARVIEARRTGVYATSESERSAIIAGLAEADHGTFVDEDTVRAADTRRRL
ncbi:hypothetical protein [Mesorhizobium sp. M1348]|uniref:hypothetical protein n=1 Tax=unclassified Mesorhizobium TaxID=325217 RepID=UPI00333CB0DD